MFYLQVRKVVFLVSVMVPLLGLGDDENSEWTIKSLSLAMNDGFMTRCFM